MGVFSRSFAFPDLALFGDERPKRKLTIPPPPESEQPDDGLMRIRGSGASVISLNHSHSTNASWSVMTETSRKSDEIRIKNPDNPDQHVDVMRPQQVNVQVDVDKAGNVSSVRANAGPASVTINYAKQPEADNVEVLREGVEERNPDAR